MRDTNAGEHEAASPAPVTEPPRSRGGDAPGCQLRSDGGESLQTHTLRLELVDEPGELLGALEPIASNGGNLLSIFHERGSLTPRGQIPVEIDIACPASRLEDILDALDAAGVNVIQVDAERYSEQVSVLLVGDLIETDLSDSLSSIEHCAGASVVDISLSAPDGTDERASAMVELAATSESIDTALQTVRSVADSKELLVIEPMLGGSR